MRQIEQVSCSLNLGLIFRVDYSYSPKEGVGITVLFSKQDGNYQKPQYLKKAIIRLGAASFSTYVVASKISLASGRRVMEVTFVDDVFRLENYLIVLTGRGCGANVFPLGTSVDTRTDAQKQEDALDPSAQQIADFTQFPDVQYTFNDFLAVLRSKFTVQITAPYNASVTNPFVGTFKEVLDSWCSFFNVSYFFENNVIKIFNPVTLSINLPSQPVDALEYEDEEDARDTYGKTCINWFQQEGGQFSLNQTSNQNGGLLVRSDNLFPAGYEFNLPQPSVDLNQVAAAQYGQEFWFLYNYSKGLTTTECGWTPLAGGTGTQNSTIQALLSVGARAVLQNNDIYQGKFEAYQTYGQQVAGRWYLSSQSNSLAIDKTFTWFQGNIGNLDEIDNQSMNLEFLTPAEEVLNIIPGTAINQYFPGVNYLGNRIVFRDDVSNSGSYNLGNLQVGKTYQSIFEVGGSNSFDFSTFDSLATGAYSVTAYNPNVSIPQNIQLLINDIPNQISGFQPRFPQGIRINGLKTEDYSSLKSSQSEPQDVQIITDNSGPSVVANTAVIKTLKNGAYTIYYDKYSQCASADSVGPYFGHRFDQRQISSDTALQFTFSKTANNTYNLERDYNAISALVNNPILPSLAQARSFTTRRVSFTVNYFRDLPINFLTNGLVSMSVSVSNDGVTSSYTFSNEVLEVPYPEKQFSDYEQSIRNSYIRQYRPNQVIT